MRARGLTRNDIIDRTGWHFSTVGRLMTGKAELTAGNSMTLARVLECPRSALFEAIGAPIPARRYRGRRPPPESMTDRLAALGALLGCDLDGLLRFVLGRDFGGMPVASARRLQEALLSGRQGGEPLANGPPALPRQPAKPRRLRLRQGDRRLGELEQ